MFAEMRLAATLQAVRCGPGALTARDALWMATREGARALGRADDLGQLTVGYRADVAVVRRDRPHLLPAADPFAAVVYAAQPGDVAMTIVDGEVLVESGTLQRTDLAAVTAEAAAQTRALVARSGI